MPSPRCARPNCGHLQAEHAHGHGQCWPAGATHTDPNTGMRSFVEPRPECACTGYMPIVPE